MSDAITAVRLACPRCTVALSPEIVGSLRFHRCGSCGGVWLDPETFRAVCEDAAKPGNASGEGSKGDEGSSPRDERVTYLRCPVCCDLMNRVNFARVSGVILDVCRAHGAWFDAGELRAVRTFVRGSGLARFARRRALDRERERQPPVPVAGAGRIDLIDELAGIPDRWGVPSSASTTRRFVRAAILATAGGAMLWGASSARMARGSAPLAGMGALLLLGALRGITAALAARSQRRDLS